MPYSSLLKAHFPDDVRHEIRCGRLSKNAALSLAFSKRHPESLLPRGAAQFEWTDAEREPVRAVWNASGSDASVAEWIRRGRVSATEGAILTELR